MSIGRIYTIDILRGFFIFMIIVDHLERFPSGFDFLTGRGLLWMSAAEGFFFLSGMMIGLIRGRKEAAKPFTLVAKTLLKRSLILFAWVVGLTLIFTWFAQLIGPNTMLKAGVWQGGFSQLLWHSITLQYVYTWSDFLRYYALYLVLAIGAIGLLRLNKAWVIAILSVAAWLLGRHTTEFFTWQVLFFGGVIAGWYWQQIIAWAKRLPRFIIALHYPLVIITLVASILTVFGPFTELNTNLAPLFNRSEMPLLRIVIFIIWFSGLYRFVASHEQYMVKTVGKFLIPFGQHSLYAYILHGFIIFFAHLYIPTGLPIYMNFLITSATLYIIWLAIKKRFLFSFIPR